MSLATLFHHRTKSLGSRQGRNNTRRSILFWWHVSIEWGKHSKKGCHLPIQQHSQWTHQKLMFLSEWHPTIWSSRLKSHFWHTHKYRDSLCHTRKFVETSSVTTEKKCFWAAAMLSSENLEKMKKKKAFLLRGKFRISGKISARKGGQKWAPHVRRFEIGEGQKKKDVTKEENGKDSNREDSVAKTRMNLRMILFFHVQRPTEVKTSNVGVIRPRFGHTMNGRGCPREFFGFRSKFSQGDFPRKAQQKHMESAWMTDRPTRSARRLKWHWGKQVERTPAQGKMARIDGRISSRGTAIGVGWPEQK